MNKFLSILGIPHLPDSSDTVYVKEIFNAAEKAVAERLSQNWAEVLRDKPDGEVPATFDGSY